GIQRDVALVIAEQVELHFIGARSCEIEVVERIPIRRNRGRVGDAVGVLPDRCLWRKKGAQGRAVCFGRVLPVCADRGPAVAEALDIRIAILRDDGGDALGVLHREAEAYRFVEQRRYLDALLEALDVRERVTFVIQRTGPRENRPPW